MTKNFFAPGLPNKKKITALPNVSAPQQWEFVIQKHMAEKAGPHFDFRIGPPGGPGFSWVIQRIPGIGEKVMALRMPDHTIKYFEFEGKIKEGYGKGTVQIHDRGKVEIISSTPTKITFNYYSSSSDFQKLSLVDTGQGWLLVNHTLPESVKKHLQTPVLKYKDQSLTYKKQDGDIPISKIDGASSLTILRADKTPLVFSKRVSKKTKRPIEYTPKLKMVMQSRSPKELGTTVLRTEVYGVTPRGEELSNSVLSGILNSSVENSRNLQDKLNTPLRLAAYDVVRFKGKDYTKKTTQEKLDAIKEISENFDIISDPREVSKKVRFPEGKVVWRDGVPIKVKTKKDFDVFVRNIYPEVKKRRAAGIEYSHTPEGPIVGRVGTGWGHKELEDMWVHPERYVNRVAKVYSQQKYPSGALRAPSFNTWHLEKNASYFIAADVPTSVEPQISHKISPKSLHVTLSYLGDKTPRELKNVKNYLARKTRDEWKDTVLESKRYDRFYPKRKNIAHRVIEPNSRLSKMVSDLNKNPTTRTTSHRKSGYKPHITVGQGKQVPKLFNRKSISIPVKRLGLYKVKHPGDYELVKDFNLKERNFLDRTMDFFKGD